MMKKMKIKVLILTSITLLLISACGEKTTSSQDIISQKKEEEGKIPLTISVKYAVYLDRFEKAAEEHIPGLDLIQVGNFTSNYSDEYAQRLENDDLTDIVNTWPLDAAARNCEERLIELSGKEFTSRYTLSMLNSISQDGKLYYVQGPTQVRGILLNKTMFEEQGWKIPTDFEEFIAVCKEIEASGIRALQLSFWNKEVLRYTFAGFGYGESFSTPRSVEALQEYNSGKGKLQDFAMPAFESFERLIAEGIIKPEDLEVRYPVREQMFYNRECAMVSDGTTLISTARKAGYKDEYVLLPFFCSGETSSWGQLIPTQYIGLNKNLEKNGNEKKMELALQLMDFISTPKGQEALADGDPTMFSSLTDSLITYTPELSYIHKTIEAGRCTVFPSFGNIEEALYQALAAMLSGEMTRDEAIAMLNEENENPTTQVKSPVIGGAKETFTLAETGSYVTDVMREKAGTDFALFLDNGKDGSFNARGISAKFYKGDILESDVELRVLPVLQHGEKGYLNIITMSGDNLRKSLEYTLEDGDWFYYFSGLKMKYNPTEEPGSRIKELSDSKGKSIESDELYTVAVMEGTVADEYIESVKTTEQLIKDIIISDIKDKGNITPAKDGRFIH